MARRSAGASFHRLSPCKAASTASESCTATSSAASVIPGSMPAAGYLSISNGGAAATGGMWEGPRRCLTDLWCRGGAGAAWCRPAPFCSSWGVLVRLGRGPSILTFLLLQPGHGFHVKAAHRAAPLNDGDDGDYHD